MRTSTAVVVGLVLALILGATAVSIAEIPEDRWIDIDKLNLGANVYYEDALPTNPEPDPPGDSMHTPTEGVAKTQYGKYTASCADLSCWLATACNILRFEGEQGLYYKWIERDGPADNQPYAWDPPGGVCHPNSGDRFTVDDGGQIHWGLLHGGLDSSKYEMELSNHENPAWPDGHDPAPWCKLKIDNMHPVGLGIWPTATRAPLRALGHAFTLWKITGADTDAPTIYVTDSDTDVDTSLRADSQHYSTTWKDRMWTFKYNGTDYAIRYAVAKKGGPSAVEQTTWGRIKSLYLQ